MNITFENCKILLNNPTNGQIAIGFIAVSNYGTIEDVCFNNVRYILYEAYINYLNNLDEDEQYEDLFNLGTVITSPQNTIYI